MGLVFLFATAHAPSWQGSGSANQCPVEKEMVWIFHLQSCQNSGVSLHWHNVPDTSLP